MPARRGTTSTSAAVPHADDHRPGTGAATLVASTAAKEVADHAVQVLGGCGYGAEDRVEQLLRDAKHNELGAGTLEAHQKTITRDLTRP